MSDERDDEAVLRIGDAFEEVAKLIEDAPPEVLREHTGPDGWYLRLARAVATARAAALPDEVEIDQRRHWWSARLYTNLGGE